MQPVVPKEGLVAALVLKGKGGGHFEVRSRGDLRDPLLCDRRN